MSHGIISASPSHSKISLPKGRSPGWAAFDLKHRGKQGMEPEIDPYPPVQSTAPSVPFFEKSIISNGPSLRSFSSVVQPSIDFPVLVGSGNCSKGQIVVADSGSKSENKAETKNKINSSLEKLKKVHSWADDGLVEDILGAVNDDFDQAFALLSSMVLSGPTEDAKECCSEKMTVQANKMTVQANKGVCSDDVTNLAELRAALDDCALDTGLGMTGEDFPVETNLSDSSRHMQLNLRHVIAAPDEPEWEEDDIYLSQRKDAIRAIRSASQHSRSANNAYMRGDRITAQKLSLKAREEWTAAEKLNKKAAEKILSIRNSEHDIWKLDLHGLHASEAVWALKDHLWKIESQTLLNSSASPCRIVKPKAGSVADKEHGIAWQRPTMLQVVTGTGNHSRGQASLPTAVRSFLIENGYRFDEARPGVIDVRPKFRHK